MGRVLIPDGLKRALLLSTAMIAGGAEFASAQSLPNGVEAQAVEEAPQLPAPTVYASPVPLARVAPPEQPKLDPAIAGAVGTVIDQSETGEGGQSTVTVVTPGGERNVRVVFNDQANPAEGDPESPENQTGAATPEGAPTRRFRAAPKPRPLPKQYGPDVAVPINSPRTRLIEGATLRALDKMTGKTRTHSIAVGEEGQIERLRVRLEGCRAPRDGDSHGTIAFLRIWDTKNQDAEAVFTGWMFAESPALSALDHPRYDLWVIKCTTSPGEQSAAKE